MGTNRTLVHRLNRHPAPGGMVCVEATIACDAGLVTHTFVGPRCGGPVTMDTGAGTRIELADTGRFGNFGIGWVLRFLAHATQTARDAA